MQAVGTAIVSLMHVPCKSCSPIGCIMMTACKKQDPLIRSRLGHLHLVIQDASLQGNPVNRSSLEALRPEGFSSILILADDTEHWAALAEHSCPNNLADADSRSLATLLLLRDIQSSRMHYSNTRQSSEI